MIVKEIVTIRDREFQKTYSDKNVLIERDGHRYISAYDPEGFYDREYTETDVPVPVRKATDKDYQSALKEFGVKV